MNSDFVDLTSLARFAGRDLTGPSLDLFGRDPGPVTTFHGSLTDADGDPCHFTSYYDHPLVPSRTNAQGLQVLAHCFAVEESEGQLAFEPGWVSHLAFGIGTPQDDDADLNQFRAGRFGYQLAIIVPYDCDLDVIRREAACVTFGMCFGGLHLAAQIGDEVTAVAPFSVREFIASGSVLPPANSAQSAGILIEMINPRDGKAVALRFARLSSAFMLALRSRVEAQHAIWPYEESYRHANLQKVLHPSANGVGAFGIDCPAVRVWIPEAKAIELLDVGFLPQVKTLRAPQTC
jgi:hypothetical protein